MSHRIGTLDGHEHALRKAGAAESAEERRVRLRSHEESVCLAWPRFFNPDFYPVILVKKLQCDFSNFT